MPDKLRAFARRRAVISAVIAGAVNLIILYFVLHSKAEVPIFALVADKWSHSLVGALIPRALIICVAVTFTTIWATIKAHYEDLFNEVPWVKITLIKALVRAVYAFFLFLALTLILRGLFPAQTTVPTSFVIPIVALFAAATAYYMTYSTVLSAESMIPPEK